MRLARPSDYHRRSAAAVVELAVVLPILMMLILGIIEFGRLLMVAQLVTNTSREGARYAVQSDHTVSDIKQYNLDYLSAAGISPSAVAVNEVAVQVAASGSTPATWTALPDAANVNAVTQGTPVRVRVNVNFSQVSWLPSGVFVGSGNQLSGITVMRKE